MKAGLGPGGVGTLYRLGLISAGRALALVVMAQSIASGVVGVIAGGAGEGAGGSAAVQSAVAWGLAAGLARALLTWAGRVASARAALGAKEILRAQLADRLLDGAPVPVGSTTILATRGLDELDEYYGSALPAVMNAAIIPLVVGVRILSADWVSAVIVVLTVPLIPVFMALVGLHTRDRVAAATTALARLGDHLVELARGLPVLVGLGRVEEQTGAMERISDDYRRTTMLTLRTAFLSSLVLELLSTISVAVVAVFIGLRLVNGSLPLETGLLVLILVPECYAPFRELGSAFHASQNGLAALRSARTILDAPLPRPVTSTGGGIVLEALGIRYRDHALPIVDRLTATIPRRRVTAIIGASGSGKSSILAVLAGRLADGTDGASVRGRILGVDAGRVAWLPQHPVTVGETVEAELRLYGEGIPAELLAARIGELAARLGLTDLLAQDPVQLSPGELRRVAFARAVLRVDAGAELLLLDEPTAHLDGESADAVRTEIRALVGAVTIVLASHDPAVNALATTSIVLGEAPPVVVPSPAESAGFTDHALDRPGRDTLSHAAPTAPARVSALRMLAGFLVPARARFAAAIVLGTAASLFAISLTAVSGWLIVRASEHPEIMYLLVAIVGVRFFGIGRSVLRYGEQLAAHDAIFRSTGRLRLRVWRAIASRGAASRGLLAGGSTVDNLVVTTDRIRDLAPRVVVPAIIGVIVSATVVSAVGLLYSAAVPLVLAMLVVSLGLAPVVAVRADRHAGVERAALGSRVARRFAALLAAAADLRSNGVDAAVRADLAALDLAAGVRARRGARALGIGQAIVVLTCCAAAVLMLPIALPAVAAGTLAGEIVAVLVLLPLAMVEPLLAVVSAVQQWPALAASLAVADDVVSSSIAEQGAPPASRPLTPVTELTLVDVSARWPDATAPTFEHLAATASRGDWLVVHGPSGSGKSTLLTVLLGYLLPSAGRYKLDGRDSRTIAPHDLHARIAWSPQEGHLFDSTIRANLLLARPRDAAPTEAELHDVLRRVGLARLVASLPEGLDARVGRQGSHLSGGERQRLSVARALLTRADILLLDEPTAHLDEQTAAAMMTDLRAATTDQLVVLVTHRPTDSAPGDLLLDLHPESTRGDQSQRRFGSRSSGHGATSTSLPSASASVHQSGAWESFTI